MFNLQAEFTDVSTCPANARKHKVLNKLLKQEAHFLPQASHIDL